MMHTIARGESHSFDPQSNGFTFPNYWTPDKATLNEVQKRLEAAIGGVFAFLAPVPAVAPLRDRVTHTVEQWVRDASLQAFGLCGGMAFAALDYYKAGDPITDHSQQSDQISPELRSYILKRMIDSLVGVNVARVLAWMVVEHLVPFGVGNRLLLRWTQAECVKLKTLIGENGGWPIALIGESKDPCHNHQVLAYQCEPGKDGCDVYVYDVNYPGGGRKLSLDFHGSDLELADDGRADAWKPLRGLFCEDYSPAEPQLGTAAASAAPQVP